jgi:hypothetical protein
VRRFRRALRSRQPPSRCQYPPRAAF